MSGKPLPTILEVGQFTTIAVDDEGLNEHGMALGDELYLAGDAIVNVAEEDPYQLRRLFIATKVVDGHIDLSEGGFTFDGLKLKPVSDRRQVELEFIRDADFSEDEEGEADVPEAAH